MKQGTMNILFFVLKTKLLKNGEAPVLMRITINGRLRRCPYPKKRASELMECGQRMQQGQGQGIHRIEYLYCGVTRTCP